MGGRTGKREREREGEQEREGGSRRVRESEGGQFKPLPEALRCLQVYQTVVTLLSCWFTSRSLHQRVAHLPDDIEELLPCSLQHRQKHGNTQFILANIFSTYICKYLLNQNFFRKKHFQPFEEKTFSTFRREKKSPKG